MTIRYLSQLMMGSWNKTFQDIIIAVDLQGFVVVVDGPNVDECVVLIGEDVTVNDYFGMEGERYGFPEEHGIYSCTIEVIFTQGYFEGYPCDSESDWDIQASDVQKLAVCNK